MSQNISKFIQVSNTVLLEYEFNRAYLSTGDYIQLNEIYPSIITDLAGENVYTERASGGSTNNSFKTLTLPVDNTGVQWYANTNTSSINAYSDYYTDITNYFDSAPNSLQIPYDTIKLHIISGYNLTDLSGISLKMQAYTNEGNGKTVTLCDYYFASGSFDLFNYVPNPLYIGTKFYDKHLEIKVPSVMYLTTVTSPVSSLQTFIDALNIKHLSNIIIGYHEINFENFTASSSPTTAGVYTYSTSNEIELPLESNADNFNLYISEGTSGNYIEFYSTWNGEPMTEVIARSLNTQISLYAASSNNGSNADTYNADNTSWVQDCPWKILHELNLTYYDTNGNPMNTGTALYYMPNQYYSISQSFTNVNITDAEKFYYRPIIVDSTAMNYIAAIKIDYICRLYNSTDGTQIVRKGSLVTYNIEKYSGLTNALQFGTNYSYKVFNKINKVVVSNQ
jgi:hypothetical protein